MSSWSIKSKSYFLTNHVDIDLIDKIFHFVNLITSLFSYIILLGLCKMNLSMETPYLKLIWSFGITNNYLTHSLARKKLKRKKIGTNLRQHRYGRIQALGLKKSTIFWEEEMKISSNSVYTLLWNNGQNFDLYHSIICSFCFILGIIIGLW